MAKNTPTMTGERPQRLTIVLSGAIALGAYEAGVVSQIAYALDKWNEARPAGEPLAIIDVIAGASAGAVTGALLARHIMLGSDPEAFHQMNAEMWCNERTTLKNLVPTRRKKDREPNRYGFLSSRAIDELAGDYFKRPASAAGRWRPSELIFTCTLTSLDRIPFRLPIVRRDGTEEAIDASTRYDWITFSITAGPDVTVVELPDGRTRAETSGGRRSGWCRVRDAALASCAIPAAWQPMRLTRHSDDYQRLGVSQWEGCRSFRYVDGGVLDNMPIKRAIHALGNLQESHPEENRVYVLIEPHPYRHKAPGRKAESVTDGRDVSTKARLAVGQVYEALTEQSFYRDLAEVQKVNRRLGVRDTFVLPMAAAAVNALPAEQVESAETAARAQLAGLLGDRHDSLTAEYELVRYACMADHPGELDASVSATRDMVTPDRWNLFLLQVALVDHMAGLKNKYPIRVERITPNDPRELAGEVLGHFGGFLDENMLHHDFHRGVIDAFAWLQKWAEAQRWPTPASLSATYPSTPEGLDLAQKNSWRDLPDKHKRELINCVLNRAPDFIIDELSVRHHRFVRSVLRALADRLKRVIRVG